MKKVFKSMMLLAAAAMAFTACNKEVDTQEPGKTGEMKKIQFSAPINDAETKATLTTEDESNFTAAWEVNDKMAIEALSDAAEYIEEGIATWNGSFFNTDLPTIDDETAGDWTYYGYYPAKENIPFGSARVQNGSAYNSAFDVMTGEVTYESAFLGQDAEGGHMVIPMQRLTAMIYFHLTSTLDETLASATLTVESAEGSPIAATAAKIANNVLEVVDGGTNSITITFAEGTAPSAQDFRLWFNTLPIIASSLTLTVTTTSGKTATLSNTNGASYGFGKLYKIVKNGLNWQNGLTKGEEWSYTFTSKVYASNDSTQELNEKNWTLAGDGNYWGYDGTKGQQFGSGGAPYKSMTLSSNFGDSYGVGTVVVNASGAKDIAATMSVTVGNKAFNCGNSNSVPLTVDATEYTFISPDGDLASGDIVISFTQTSSKAIYVKTITVNPDEREKQILSFSETSLNVELGQSFTAPILTGAHTDVTYESSNTAVAMVDASTGAIEIKGIGSSTITATAAASEQYQSASASYEITVTKGIISIAEVYEAASGDVVKTRGIVASINTKGYIITDGTNNLNVYTNSAPSVTLGDDVTVSGTRDIYNGVPQLSDPELTATNATAQEIVRTEQIIITKDNATGHTNSSYVSLTGSLSKNNNYYNVSIEGSTTQGSLYSPSATQEFTGGTLANLVGNQVIVTGYLVGSSSGYLYISVVDIDKLPYLNYTEPDAAGFAEDSQITIPVDANVIWTAAKGTDEDGIIKSVTYDSEKVTVTFNANGDEEEKTATVVITPNSESGLSAVEVTVTQNKYGEVVETVVYTLDGTKTGGSNGYATASDITQNEISWKVTGNTTTNPWRIGGNSLTNVDRTVYSTTTLNNNISKIEIIHGSASSITVNSMTVIVSKNEDFSNPVSTIAKTFVANGTVTVDRPDGADWSKCYYKIVYNVTVSGTSNRFVQFIKADFTGK